MSQAPRRVIGFWDLTLYAVAVGFGLRWVAYAAAAGPASMPLWLIGMVGFLGPLIAATAELVGRFPSEGGIYNWTRETVGPFAGFITGWLYWTCNLPFFSGLLYFILANFAAAMGPAATHALADPWLFAAIACGVAIAVGALHWVGLGAGKWLTNFGSIAAALLTAILLALGLAVALRSGPATDFVHASYAPPLTADGAALWAIMVFAYGGPEALAFLREDVDGGVRQIVRVLILVGVVVFAAYIAGTLAMLSILRPSDASRLAGLPDAYTIGFARLGLKSLAPVSPILIGLMALGGYSAWFGLAARLPFAIGVDRYFPAAFARRDPRTDAPTTAILVQVVAVVVLVILGQAGASVKAAYDFLTSMSVISYTLPFVFLFLAYLRANGPVAPGVWVAPGGPAGRKTLAWMGLAVTATAIACTIVPSPDATDKLGAVVKLVVASAALIGIGAAIYAAASRRRRTAVQDTAG
ncbi:MAG TPA: APC family permease [Caulobacteraceae bacterium]